MEQREQRNCGQGSKDGASQLRVNYDEVLGAAQFTERSSISCQKMSKAVISCHKLS